MFKEIIFVFLLSIGTFWVEAAPEIKDVTPYFQSNDMYPANGVCARTYHILLNDTNIYFQTSSMIKLLNEFEGIKLYEYRASFSPRAGPGMDDISFSDTDSNSYVYPQFLKYYCPSTTPLPNFSYNRTTIYPELNVNGYYGAILNSPDYQYYMSIQTSGVTQFVGTKSFYYTFSIVPSSLLGTFVFSIQDSNGGSKTLSLPSFVTTDNLMPAFQVTEYPQTVDPVNYYHLYWTVKIATTDKYLLAGVGHNLNSKILLPVSGQVTNATYLLVGPYSDFLLTKTFQVAAFQGSSFSPLLTHSRIFVKQYQYSFDSINAKVDDLNSFYLESESIRFEGVVYLKKSYTAMTNILPLERTLITQYPFGYLSVNATGMKFGAMFPAIDRINPIQFSFAQSFASTLMSQYSFGFQEANYASVIDSIELLESDTDVTILMAVHQPYFGSISMICVQSQGTYSLGTVLTQSHLVKGSMVKGLFRKVISKKELIQWEENLVFTIYNQKFNTSATTSYRVYNRNGAVAPSNPTTLPPLPDGILDMYFEKNDVDVSYLSVSNSLYIKLNSTKQNYLLSFTPSFYLHYSRYDINQQYLDETSFYSVWDKSKECYRVDFTIPQNRYTGVIGYKLMPYNRDHVFWVNLIGDKAELRVKSTNADMLPPIVRSVNQYPSFSISPTQNTAIGFRIAIEDDVNGFKNGLITIKSEYDRQGYNFTITPADAVSGNMYYGEYSLYFQVTTKDISQEFYISYMRLEDTTGNTAIYPSYDDVSPLLKFEHSLIPKITLTQATPVADIKPPFITKLVYYPKEINDTTEYITIEFIVKDDTVGISSRHMPSVYLTSSLFEILSNTSQSVLSVNLDNTSTYKTSIYIPRGFGVPYVYLSIYNLVDNNLNIGAYTAQDLYESGLPYKIDSSIANTPIIVSAVNTKSNEYLIQGARFGLVAADVSIKVTQSNGVDSYLIKNFISFSFEAIATDQIDSYDGKDITIQIFVDGVASNIYSISIAHDSSSSGTTNQPFCITDAKCGGSLQGQCKNGNCVCINPYYGIDCTSKLIDNSTQTINQTVPSVTIDYKSLSSLVSIYSLKELDMNGGLLSEHVFRDWNYTQAKNTYFYKTFVQNTEIKVTLEKFEQETNITFAGSNIIMQPLSIKYTIDLGPYPFVSSLNSLQLVMRAGIETTEKDSCSVVESGVDNNSEIDYCRVQINDVSLYGRFIKRGIVDSRIRSITNTISDDKATSSSSSTNSFIGINIPNYKRFVKIDPDFSVLVDSVPANSRAGSQCSSSLKESKSGLSVGQIVGIAVGGAVFLLILIFLILLFITRKFEDKTIGIKLRRVLKNIVTNNAYASNGRCNMKKYIVVNSTGDAEDITLPAEYSLKGQYDRVSFYIVSLLVQGSPDVGYVDLVYNISTKQYTLSNFFKYSCPNTAPLIQVEHVPTLYSKVDPFGKYILTGKFLYDHYMIFSPGMPMEMIDIQYTVFIPPRSISDLSLTPTISYPLMDSFGQNINYNINNFITSLHNLDTINPIATTPNVNVLYYHSYFLFKVETSDPYYLTVDDTFGYSQILLPISGSLTNATYLMKKVNPDVTTSKTFETLSFKNSSLSFSPIYSEAIDFTAFSQSPQGSLLTQMMIGDLIIYGFKVSPVRLDTTNILKKLYFTNQVSRIVNYNYGLTGGSKTNVERTFLFPSAKNITHSIQFGQNFNNLGYPTTISIGDSSSDTPPSLDIFEIQDLGQSFVFIIGVTQPKGGYTSSIIITTALIRNTIEIYPSDLVKGSIEKGVFKKIVLKKEFINLQGDLQILILNRYWQATSFSSGYLFNKFGGIIPSNPNSATIRYPTFIKEIYFEKNDVDVSNGPVSNSLYIKLDSAKQNYVLSFKPSFHIHLKKFNPNDANLDETTFYSVWDTIKSCYRIDFTIPAKRFSGPIGYQIMPLNVDNTRLYNVFNTDAELRVFSSNADMMPPLVSFVNAFYQNPKTLAFKLTVLDDSGFKMGKITIKSELDYQGYNFTFTPNDATIAEDTIFNSTFVFPITIPDVVVSSEYYISYLYLEDVNGDYSIYPSYDDISPFLMYDHNAIPKFSLIAGNPSETNPPTIISFKVTPDHIDETTTSISFYFTISDGTDGSGVSLRHLPEVYLTSVHSQVIGNQSTILSSSLTSVDYLCKIIIPAGFGAPIPVLISVFNIYDNLLNINSYSTNNLNSAGFQYSLSSTMGNGPVLTQSNSITQSNQIVSIQGVKFGLDPSVVRIKVTQSNGISYYITNFLSFDSNLIQTDEIDSFDTKNVNIQLEVDGELSNSLEVAINIPASTNPPSNNIEPICTSDTQCGGSSQGQCKNGNCICISPFYGIDCTSKLVANSTQTINQTIPDIFIAYQSLSSLVSIYSLKELNNNGDLVFETKFKDWNYTKDGNLNTYVTTVKGSTIIKVIVEKFEQETNITFAGSNIIMQPLSIKYTIDLGPYPFVSSLNSLQLVMKAGIETIEKDSCSVVESGADNNSEIDYCRVQINDVSLYGRFIKRGIVDSRISSITNTISTNPTESSSNMTNSFIGINIPNYKRFVRIDPDFSVLIDSRVASTRSGAICSEKEQLAISNGLTAAQITGIVIGGVAFLVLLIAGTAYILHKRSIKLRIFYLRTKGQLGK
ncbi:hypothetical protein CYY_007566 [Polysphondylium violaceum]|uniref:EGF-like domain-containing protein n=1 Tax=Polysphondylium violaceum TaxID=133409 RepID=A0A8J4PP42_9MYCE|nr:hypothetical protein CYY_007566 [Polysphondylium violaceum]